MRSSESDELDESESSVSDTTNLPCLRSRLPASLPVFLCQVMAICSSPAATPSLLSLNHRASLSSSSCRRPYLYTSRIVSRKSPIRLRCAESDQTAKWTVSVSAALLTFRSNSAFHVGRVSPLTEAGVVNK